MGTTMRLLLIEDDPDTASFISKGLAAEGHNVRVCHTAEEGLAWAIADPFDVLVIDRMLPDMDGIAVIAEARQRGATFPVLMLTALGSIEDRVTGLHGGADDYLVKPFAMAELSARIVALARRSSGTLAELASCGSIRIDRARREVWRSGQRIILQPREFELLDQLVRHGGRVVSRAMLLERVWQFHFDPQTNIVETHMSRLRQKLNAGFDIDAIQTVRGVGYRLRGDA
jgi:two-component system, OmpR family, response regulator